MIRTIAIAGLIGATLLAAGGASAQPGAPWDSSFQPYAKPQILASLPDGRKIHLFCLGTGAPTVLLLSGLAAPMEAWRKVQGPVAARTRVCGWDRAGYGFSSPSPEPQDIAHTTQDLEAALKAAKIAGPYVLVGASMGGYETLRFADRNPRDVVGIVLADPSIPNQVERFQAVSPAYTAWSEPGRIQAQAAQMRCAELFKSAPAGNADVEQCLGWRPGTPEDVKQGQRPYRLDPARPITQRSLTDNFPVSAKQVINPSRNYGRTPLIVLTAGAPDTPPGMTPQAAADQPATLVEWNRAHLAYATLSSRGVRRVVDGASHGIGVVKPQAVIDAIDEVVGAARAR